MKLRLILFIATFLAGCASYNPEKNSSPELWEPNSNRMNDLKDWRISAKLSIKSPGSGFTGRIDWTQKESSYRILISGPLGFGHARIEGNETSAHMEHNEEIFVGSPDMLILDAIGIPIPIDGWRWWLSGSPSPIGGPVEFADIVLDSHATSFSQDGWYLSFSDYSLTPIGYLPGKITGKRDNLSFKLIVSEWKNPGSK